MPLPGNVTTITVTGTYIDFTGQAMTGSITFTPPAELIDASGTTLLSPGPVTLQLDSNGHFSVVLPCTDNVNLLPLGWVYVVTENVRGLRSYPLALPHTLGSTVDLSTIAPASQV
jgi:hypothetical protein